MSYILRFLPVWFQNLAVTVYNAYQYKVRHSGVYSFYFDYYDRW